MKNDSELDILHNDGESEDWTMSNANNTQSKANPFSRVNFTNLNNEEKEERLRNMAKLVKKAKRRLNTFEDKYKKNPIKYLKKHFERRLKSKERRLFSFDDLEEAVKNLAALQTSMEDEKEILLNLVKLLVNKEFISSLKFKRICSIIRSELIQVKSYKEGCSINYNEHSLPISREEYNHLGDYRMNQKALNSIYCFDINQSLTHNNINNNNINQDEKKKNNVANNLTTKIIKSDPNLKSFPFENVFSNGLNTTVGSPLNNNNYIGNNFANFLGSVTTSTQIKGNMLNSSFALNNNNNVNNWQISPEYLCNINAMGNYNPLSYSNMIPPNLIELMKTFGTF